MNGRFIRLDEIDRKKVSLIIDGNTFDALEGDTLMIAILNATNALRDSEFGDGRRSGFCLMGACQDCWVWTINGEHIRACSTIVKDGMNILTHQPEAAWPNLV